MEDVVASRKALLQITTTSDEEDGEGKAATTAIWGGRQTSKNRSIRYVCPVYDAIIRAIKQVNMVCGDCNVPFEKA